MGLTTHILQAFSFTIGCIAIHTLRSHAETLTEVLTFLVLALMIAMAAMGINRLAADQDYRADATVDLSQAL